MDGLELQAAVEEVQPGGAIDVHGGAEHLLRKGLVHAEIGGAHCKVAKGDLHVQQHRDRVADHHEDDAVRERRDTAVEDTVAEPGPKEDVASDLEPSVPPGGTLLRALAEQEVFPAEPVKVEAAESENWVIQEVLVADEESCGGIVRHYPVVVGGPEGVEEAVGDGEERHVLNIRIVLGRVCDYVVNVVVLFPPA